MSRAPADAVVKHDLTGEQKGHEMGLGMLAWEHFYGFWATMGFPERKFRNHRSSGEPAAANCSLIGSAKISDAYPGTTRYPDVERMVEQPVNHDDELLPRNLGRQQLPMRSRAI